jgi:transcriptional regulator with XRE-family HTH domain
LSAYRYKALFTQQELADRSGAQQHTIYRVESGHNADFKTIKQLAAGLGITTAQLLNQDPGGKSMTKQQYRAWAEQDAQECAQGDYDAGWRYEEGREDIIERAAEDLGDERADRFVGEAEDDHSQRRAFQKDFAAIFEDTYIAEMKRLTKGRRR